MRLEKGQKRVKTAFGSMLGESMGVSVAEYDEVYRVEGCKVWRKSVEAALRDASKKYGRTITREDLSE